MAAFIEHRTTQDSAISNNCQVKWKLVRRSLMKRIKKGFSAWSSHKHTRLHPLVLSGPPLLPPLSSHLTLVSMVTQNPSAAVRPVKCSAISSLPCSFEPTKLSGETKNKQTKTKADLSSLSFPDAVLILWAHKISSFLYLIAQPYLPWREARKEVKGI